MMGSLVIPSQTAVDELPLGRRIREIMHEKGKAFTRTAVAMRMGIARDSLRRMIVGEREVYNFELMNLSKALKEPPERILQNDIKKDYLKFRDALTERDYSLAKEIAAKLVSLAIGVTERCRSLNDLGRAFYYLEDYDKAHECWLTAYSYADEATKFGGSCEPILNVAANLMITYSLRREFTLIKEVVSKVEIHFDRNPQRSGVICYTLAKIAEEKGDVSEARKQYYDALEFYNRTENPIFIAKANHFVACFEYRQQNYQISKDLYEQALPFLSDDQKARLICIKEYAKTLLKLGDRVKAERLVREALGDIQLSGAKTLSELYHQFLLVLGVSLNDPCCAERVLSIEEASTDTKLIASEFLLNYYSNIDDSSQVLKYYKIERQLRNSPDTLDRKGV